MNSFVTTELKTPSYFSDEVFLDKTFLLLPKSLPVTEPLLSALRDWEFKEIFSLYFIIYYLMLATRLANIFGFLYAMSAKIFLSNIMLACFNPYINLE